jgi:hypothetical protein
MTDSGTHDQVLWATWLDRLEEAATAWDALLPEAAPARTGLPEAGLPEAGLPEAVLPPATVGGTLPPSLATRAGVVLDRFDALTRRAQQQRDDVGRRLAALASPRPRLQASHGHQVGQALDVAG